MVASANLRHGTRRLLVAAWLFAGLVLAGAVFTAEKAVASCGDYLLHGPVNAPETDAHQSLGHRFANDPFLNPHVMDTEPSPQPPTSPCANGRCQSAPPHPPANSPTRAVYTKQPVVMDSLASVHSDPDPVDWLYPADGLRPEGPWIAVDLPPPKRARSHA
jgi:hypothetical protein